MKDEIRNWWTTALLNQEASAHPVFGEQIKVEVDDDVLTLRGEVKTAEAVEEIEREARGLPSVHTIINHLTVSSTDDRYHFQTVVASFPTEESARLAARTVADAAFHTGRRPDVLRSRQEAEPYLQTRAKAAGIETRAIDRYLQDLEEGRVLLVDRVPEDDALRVISVLEGSPAHSVYTLPPEPGSTEAT